MVPSTCDRPGRLAQDAAPLVFRVRGSSLDDQLVRIRSAKFTIGSGRNCALRLIADGVRRLHCVVLRGANRVVVRRWAPGTRLNGAAFSDAPLAPGDVLSIGPVQLEAVELGNTACQDESAAVETTRARLAAEREQQHAELSAAQQQLQSDRQQLDIDHRELADAQEKLRQANESLTERTAQVAACEQRLTEDDRTRTEQFELRESELRHRQQQLEAQSETLHLACAEMEARQALLAERCDDLQRREADMERLQSHLSDRANALDEREAEFARQREAWTAERANKNADCRALPVAGKPEREAAAPSEDVRPTQILPSARQTAPIPVAAGASDSEDSVADRLWDQAGDEATESRQRVRESLVMESDAPAGQEDDNALPEEEHAQSDSSWRQETWLAGSDPDSDAEEQPAEAAENSVRQTQPWSRPRTEQDRPGSHGDTPADEPTIDQYMAELLARLRGGPSTDAPPKPVGQPTQRSKATKVAPVTPSPAAAPSHQQPADTPQRRPKRSLPPELTSDLATMRELANSSARTAVKLSTRRRWTEAAVGKLVVGGVAVLCSGLLIAWSPAVQSHYTLAAAVSLAVAVFWILQGGILLRNVQIAKQHEQAAGRSGAEPTNAADSADGGAGPAGATSKQSSGT